MTFLNNAAPALFRVYDSTVIVVAFSDKAADTADGVAAPGIIAKQQTTHIVELGPQNVNKI